MRSSLILSGLFCAVIVAGCNEPPKPVPPSPPTQISKNGTTEVVASGADSSRNFNVAPFSQVEVDGPFEVDVKLGGQTSVQADAKETVLPLVDVKVSGERLIITTTRPYSSNQPIKVHIVTTSLGSLTLTGAANAVAESKDTSFEGRLDGGSRLRLQTDARTITLSARGASEATLSGATPASGATLFATGASKIHAEGLTLEAANAQAKGASQIGLPELKSLTAVATGASNVKYKGDPKLVKNDAEDASSISGE